MIIHLLCLWLNICIGLLFLAPGSQQAQERCVAHSDLQVNLCSVCPLLPQGVQALGETVGTTDSTRTPVCPTCSRASSRNSWTHCMSEQLTWAQWPLRGSLQLIWWLNRNPLTTLMSLVSTSGTAWGHGYNSQNTLLEENHRDQEALTKYYSCINLTMLRSIKRILYLISFSKSKDIWGHYSKQWIQSHFLIFSLYRLILFRFLFSKSMTFCKGFICICPFILLSVFSPPLLSSTSSKAVRHRNFIEKMEGTGKTRIPIGVLQGVGLQ